MGGRALHEHPLDGPDELLILLELDGALAELATRWPGSIQMRRRCGSSCRRIASSSSRSTLTSAAPLALQLEDLPDLARFRLEHIGFVFQGFRLVEYLTVLENVLLPLALRGDGTATPAEPCQQTTLFNPE